MGKFAVVLAVLFAVPAAAAAQDFGVEWLDRVTHLQQQERGPLRAQPVDWMAQGGLLGYIDNNVFLRDKDGKTPGDVILIPFVRGTMSYSEQRFEADADLMVDYKGYMDVNHDTTVDFTLGRAWEERFYGHARYVDARFTLGLDELIRHESDATDAVFLSRVKRTVWDSVLQGTYDFTRSITGEIHGDYQVVRFEDPPFTTVNNDNYTVDAALVYRQANGYDWLVQLGWKDIFYVHSQNAGAPPDASGYYVHGGFRGELMQRVWLEALIGWISVQSDRFVGTSIHEEEHTADIAIHLRYELTEKSRVYGDFTRTIGFSSSLDGSPFQVVNRFGLIGEWDATDALTLRARIQWDHVVTAFNIQTEYHSYSISGTYRISEHFAVDGGGTYRMGNVHGAVAGALDFNDAIGHLGVVITY